MRSPEELAWVLREYGEDAHRFWPSAHETVFEATFDVIGFRTDYGPHGLESRRHLCSLEAPNDEAADHQYSVLV